MYKSIIKSALYALCLIIASQACKIKKTIQIEGEFKLPFKKQDTMLRKNFSTQNHSIGFELIEGVSKSIPDQTYTIRELLKKHSRGLDMGLDRTPIWGEDQDHDSIDLQKYQRLDIGEKLLFQQNQKEQLTSMILDHTQREVAKSEAQKRTTLERTATDEDAQTAQSKQPPSLKETNIKTQTEQK